MSDCGLEETSANRSYGAAALKKTSEGHETGEDCEEGLINLSRAIWASTRFTSSTRWNITGEDAATQPEWEGGIIHGARGTVVRNGSQWEARPSRNRLHCPPTSMAGNNTSFPGNGMLAAPAHSQAVYDPPEVGAATFESCLCLLCSSGSPLCLGIDTIWPVFSTLSGADMRAGMAGTCTFTPWRTVGILRFVSCVETTQRGR